MDIKSALLPLVPFLKYISFGSFCAGTHFAILIFCVEVLHFNPTLSTTIGLFIATALNYILQRQWTFKSNMAHNRAFFRYCLVTAITMCLNILLFWTLTIPFKVWYIYSQFVVTIIIAVMNFLINRHFTFKDEFMMSQFRTSFSFTCNHGTPILNQCAMLVMISAMTRGIYLCMTQSVTGDAIHYAIIAESIGKGVIPYAHLEWMNLFCYWEGLFRWIGLPPVAASITSTYIPGIFLVCPVVFMSRILYSERTAWIAALFTAFHPRLIEYSCNGHSEMFYLFFFTIAIAFWTMSYFRQAYQNYMLGAGMCFGVYMGVRKEALVPFAACLTLDGIFGPKQQLLKRMLYAIGGLLVVGIILGEPIRLLSPQFPSLTYFSVQIELLIEKIPRILLSPIFLFAFCLPFFSSRKHLPLSAELPLLVMLFFPLIYFPFVQVLPRFLLPILIPIHIFGAAGIITLTTYVTKEVLKRERVCSRYLVAPILLVFFIISLFLGQVVEERRNVQIELKNIEKFALSASSLPNERTEIDYKNFRNETHNKPQM